MKRIYWVLFAAALIGTTGGMRFNSPSQQGVRRQAVVIEAADLHLNDDFVAPGFTTTHWFNDLCKRYQPDAIMIAGDIFVNVLPGSGDSVRAYFADSMGMGRPVYCTVGNHDHSCDTYRAGAAVATVFDSLNTYWRVNRYIPGIPKETGSYYVDVGNQRWIFFPDQFNGTAEPCSTARRTPFSPLGESLYQPNTDWFNGKFAVTGSPMNTFLQSAITTCTKDWCFFISHHGTRGIQGVSNNGDWHWQQLNVPGNSFLTMIQNTRTQAVGSNGAFMGLDVWWSGHQHMYARFAPEKNNLARAGKTSLDSSIVRIIGPSLSGTHVIAVAAWDSAGGTKSPDTCRIAADYSGVSDSAYVVNHWTTSDKVLKFDSCSPTLGSGHRSPAFNVIETYGLSMQVTVHDSTDAVFDRWGITK